MNRDARSYPSRVGTRRRVPGARLVASILVLAAPVLVSCSSDDDGSGAPEPTTSVVASTTTTAPAPSTSPSSVSTSTTGTSAPPGVVPSPVTVVSAGPGGGSGEIELTWDAVDEATGYRVARSASSDGPFDVSADVDVVDGTATVASGVTNVYSQQRSYFPSSATTSSPAGDDIPSRFHYIEVTSARTYLHVTAYNATGEAHTSAGVCASPVGATPC